jgi:signal transduction histidine kinase
MSDRQSANAAGDASTGSNSAVSIAAGSRDIARVQQSTLISEEQAHRISRALHNQVGQLLTAALLNLEFWRGSSMPDDERAAVVAEVRQALVVVRELSQETRSAVLDAGGLIPALQRHLLVQSAATRLQVQWQPVELVMPRAIEVATFRVLREVIDNVVRHASATTLSLELEISEGFLHAMVRDDGVGFIPAHALQVQPEGGLAEMQQFVGLFGGIMRVDSEPDAGTTVRIRIPVDN